MALEIPGIKLGLALAGLAGGVVSLSYIKPLTKWQAFLAVFTGAVSAAYTTPLIASYFNLAPAAEHGAGFLIGLVAMNLIPGIIKLSDRFKTNPEDFIKK